MGSPNLGSFLELESPVRVVVVPGTGGFAVMLLKKDYSPITSGDKINGGIVYIQSSAIKELFVLEEGTQLYGEYRKLTSEIEIPSDKQVLKLITKGGESG